MSDQADFLKDLRAAVTRTAGLYLRNVESLNSLVSEECPPARQARNELEARLYDVLFEAARLHLSVYNELLSISGNYADYYVDTLRRLARPPAAASASVAATARRQIIEASGELGDTVAVRFTVDQQLTTREEIALAVSDFRPLDGGDAVPASVKCEILPDRAPAPGERRSVRVTVQLAHPFAAGKRYAATVRMIARDRVVESVPVEIEVTQPRMVKT
jgi:hypothetical protein